MGLLKDLFMDYWYHKDYVSYAKKLGVQIGDRCKILSNPRKCFGTEPWLIKIGSHVELSGDVRLLTHDGSTWIVRDKHPEMAVWGTIEIGDNVFIGNRAIILPNIKIGNNCVIAAGAIVTKDIPDNSVAAGIPARVIDNTNSLAERLIKKAIPVLNMKKNERKIYSQKVLNNNINKIN